MLLQSLHTHSLYDDGQDTLARMAQNAEAAGLDALGFSGHSPLPFANDWAIDQSCLADYLREARSLQADFRGRFSLYCGLEWDSCSPLPEQKLGQIPGSGGSARLQKIVGITRTKDIVMRSKRISGKQALDWGIATECVPDGELEAATDRLVDELRSFSPIAQRTAKKLLNDTDDAHLTMASELEGLNYSRLRQADDFREGVEAFHAKRKPVFKGK